MTTYRVTTAAAVSNRECPSCTVYEGPSPSVAQLVFRELDALGCLYVTVWASDQREPIAETKRKSAAQLSARYRADSHEATLRGKQ